MKRKEYPKFKLLRVTFYDHVSDNNLETAKPSIMDGYGLFVHYTEGEAPSIVLAMLKSGTELIDPFLSVIWSDVIAIKELNE